MTWRNWWTKWTQQTKTNATHRQSWWRPSHLICQDRYVAMDLMMSLFFVCVCRFSIKVWLCIVLTLFSVLFYHKGIMYGRSVFCFRFQYEGQIMIWLKHVLLCHFSIMRSVYNRKKTSFRSKSTGLTHNCRTKPKSLSHSDARRWVSMLLLKTKPEGRHKVIPDTKC